jgi:hypothetical protein
MISIMDFGFQLLILYYGVMNLKGIIHMEDMDNGHIIYNLTLHMKTC